jgi:hypothetical protein
MVRAPSDGSFRPASTLGDDVRVGAVREGCHVESPAANSTVNVPAIGSAGANVIDPAFKDTCGCRQPPGLVDTANECARSLA